MPMAEICYQPLTALSEEIRTRRISPVEVTNTLLNRIEAIDPELKSYTTVTKELALEQAERAETEIASGKCRGPLHGVPIAVKDLCYTTRISGRTTTRPSSSGSPMPERCCSASCT